jgi:hypothetical protein
MTSRLNTLSACCPPNPLSVERNRHRIEIDEEETTKLDAAGYGDMDTDVARLFV